MLTNIIAGSLAAGVAAQATDMVGDLKTGHLLRAKPKNQFAAQLFGATIAIFLTAGLFVLFTTASPCIITGDTPCAYGAPSISAWAAVAYAVTASDLRYLRPLDTAPSFWQAAASHLYRCKASLASQKPLGKSKVPSFSPLFLSSVAISNC